MVTVVPDLGTLAAVSPRLHSPAASLLADCGADGDRIRDHITPTSLREAPELPGRLSHRTPFSRVRIRPSAKTLANELMRPAGSLDGLVAT